MSKFYVRCLAASTLAAVVACSGKLDGGGDEINDTLPIEGQPQGPDAVEPTTNDGTSSAVGEPTNLRVSAATQTAITIAWGAPRKGTALSYAVYVNGSAKADTRDTEFTHAQLTCGTSYTLEVAARDAQKLFSARSRLSATTAACGATPASPTDYAGTVLQDAPVSYWRLNESQGTRVADSAGGNHGSYDNGPKLGASGIDGAVSFDGIDDVVTIADTDALRLNGSFTIEFMAKLGADANSFPGILAKGSSSSGSTGYSLYYSPGHKHPTFKRAGVDGMDTSEAGALDGDFKHYAFAYDSAASTAKWYVGGQLDTEFDDVHFPVSSDGSPLYLGRGDSEAGKVQFGNEVLDEVALYKTALAADRVKAHFAASGLGGTPMMPAAPAMPEPNTPLPAPTEGFPIGVCAYKTQDLAKIKDIGMHHARWDRPSAQLIEQARGYGIELLPIADYGFGDLSADGSDRSPPKPEHRATWAKRMVDTWRGMSNPPKVIEVWNEPWHQGFYGGKPNPADYLQLVKAFANEAWKQWPNVTLLVSADAGMSDYPTFRRDLLAADKDHFLADARILPTTHNYVENRTPTQVTGNSCTYDLNRYQCAFQDFKKHGHPNPQVWVTEFGWESNSGGQGSSTTVSEQQQGQYTLDALEMFRKSGMVAAAYSFMLNSNDRWNYNWLRPNNSDKPIVQMVKSYLATH